MQLEVNGQSREDVPEGSIAELVEFLGLVPETVLVEHNGTALLRSEWNDVTLREGDCIEILRVAAGG